MCAFKGRNPEIDDRLGDFLWELENRPQPEILPSEVVKFSDPLRAVFNHATRMGRITLTDVSEKLDLPPEQAQKVIDNIFKKGFLRLPSPLDEEPVYETRLAVHTRRREDRMPKDILKKLDGL
jgi:hypothetical protein